VTSALQAIRQNIEKHGHHVYLITGEASPRFGYTIGLTDALGAELVLAGAVTYSAADVQKIVNACAERLRAGASFADTIELDEFGAFELRAADPAWLREMLRGAFDYYRGREIRAFQIVPDEEHWTIDIPDLEKPFDADEEPAWRWFWEDWPYAVPRHSIATTNLDALRGEPITEAARWEETEWELFAGAGPDVKREDARVVPLGVLLGFDRSLEPAVELEVGKALWREGQEDEWHAWGSADRESSS
jgi:hypothetical protein